MTTISVEEIQHHAPALLERVEQGEAFVIARDGKPVGKLEPIAEVVPARRFRIGMLEGQGTFPDDIKGPYEVEINEMFYGK